MATQPVGDTSFFGHPRGLSTLFFTEMWERFSYYGMRAILLLFMVAQAENGGLGMDKTSAGAVYAIFAASVYLLGLPGGWVADRIIGQRKAVLYGGIVIALGNALLAAPLTWTFYLGLGLICVGTGLLKTNASTMVGSLYAPGDNRRDAGFSIYYMGINLGALLAPLAIGYVGQTISWRLAFLLVTVGMTAGLIQYVLTQRHLGDAGLRPAAPPDAGVKRQLWGGGAVLLGLPLALGTAQATGATAFSAAAIADGFSILLVTCFLGIFGALWAACKEKQERRNIAVIFCLFLASALFWSSFEQAGTTLNLFADEKTRNEVFGWVYPSSWFQSMNSIWLILLAPVFSMLWIKMGNREPSVPAKFALGLLFVGLGFLALVPPAGSADAGFLVGPGWLTLTYLLHTIGELCLSPVGLSAMTKLAPARFGGVIMGVFFMSISTGNYIGGRLAGFYESMKLADLFLYVAFFGIGAAALLGIFVKPLRGLMGEVK
ncbi:MAG TPA: peptide MFS transporter [Bryobacteraceae bacterium]|nr:peptide MFS transporter [Bryobacteraceae bacterium]